MKDAGEIRTEVDNFISEIKSAKDVFELFGLLNYPKDVIFDTSFKRKVEQFDFRKEDKEKIKEIYTVLSFGEDLPVFLIETMSLSSQLIRSITKTLSDRYIKFLLILTSDYDTMVVIFPDLERIEAGKHKLKITKLTLLKDELCYSDIDTLSNIFYEGKEESWRDVWKKWKEAFNVEKVTNKFFEDYQSTFFQLRKKLDKEGISRKDAHGFALQFLNRIMFIYFVSKKRWLNDDPKFMKWLWTKYLTERNRGKVDKNSFYKTWLKTIFFEAFNNQPITTEDLPPDVKFVLSTAPFLNGGLFTENDLDKLPVKINDKLFKDIFDFFEKYRFTIREDMPLEYEVAVNPQMLGYVYESLANVAEEIYDRNDMGIFYTPTVEVDFMCRRSLVEYLEKHLAEVPKEIIYEFVFDEDKSKAGEYFEKEKLWHKLEEVLDDLSVVDPACGSGAFLVGMLNVLAELYKTIYKNIKRSFKDFGLKSKIIGHSLYGVDVMGWAVHCAELRLWLQLIVETELKKEDLKKHALLPNLNLNLRIGDSLVQEIGGINLHLRDTNISNKLKKTLYNLKNEKEKYFNNDPTAKFDNKDDLLREETRIFGEIIEERLPILKKKEILFKQRLEKLRRTKQTDLSGKVSESEQQKILDKAKKVQKYLEETEKKITELEIVKENLHDPEKKPFVWDIDFAEIFGDKGGFDIVIGNPPYVRHGKISPPNTLKEEVSNDDKKIYKSKLRKSISSNYPFLPRCKKNLKQFKDIDQALIDGQSDYYIYFYYDGLSILNPKGTFCFITSNSWLDVGYGKELQEFLLKYVPIYAIYDNSAKRSFVHADINTIIALLGAPNIEEEMSEGGIRKTEKVTKYPSLLHTAKFVMFKRPFEEVLSSKNLLGIENSNINVKSSDISELVKNIVRTNDYRLFPIAQVDLLEDGWVYPKGYDANQGRFKKGKYEGNKWGGKYLNAPDIYFTILRKGKEKLIRLGDIAEVNEGRPTGANNYFFMPIKIVKKYKIEKEFLLPGIMKTRGMNYLVINQDLIDRYFLQISKSVKKIKKMNVWKYIEYGKKNILPKSNTLKAKTIWWHFNYREPADLLMPCGYGETAFCAINQAKAIASNSYTEIRLKDKRYRYPLFLFINSSIGWLSLEILGRKSLGGGMIKVDPIEYRQLSILKKKYFTNKFSLKNREIKSIFEECGFNPQFPIRDQEPNPLPNRKELDDIIFDILGLTPEERKEVYWSVCELVKDRNDKARSFKKGK